MFKRVFFYRNSKEFIKNYIISIYCINKINNKTWFKISNALIQGKCWAMFLMRLLKNIKIRYTLIYTFITIFNIFKYDLRLLLIYCEKTYIVIIN